MTRLNTSVRVYDTELEMMNAFFAFVRSYNGAVVGYNSFVRSYNGVLVGYNSFVRSYNGVVVGYNSLAFDIPFSEHRMNVLYNEPLIREKTYAFQHVYSHYDGDRITVSYMGARKRRPDVPRYVDPNSGMSASDRDDACDINEDDSEIADDIDVLDDDNSNNEDDNEITDEQHTNDDIDVLDDDNSNNEDDNEMTDEQHTNDDIDVLDDDNSNSEDDNEMTDEQHTNDDIDVLDDDNSNNDLTRFNQICHPSQRPRWQVDKEAYRIRESVPRTL